MSNNKIINKYLNLKFCAKSCLLLILIAINIQVCEAFSLKNFALKYYKNNNNLLEYSIILNNGDIISGNITECVTNTNSDINQNTNIHKNNQNIDIKNEYPYIVIKAFDNEVNVVLYEDEIADIIEKIHDLHQNHSLYIMPTANPIKNNCFIGNYEIALFYGGFGLTDWISITAGHSIIPSTNANEQISVVNAKFSFPNIVKEDSSNIAIAVGTNIGWINLSNKMFHLFAIGTYNSSSLNNSNFSFGVFYKLGYQDYPSTVRLAGRTFTFNYPDGSIGLCAGFEKRFAARKELSLLLEIWNSDITRPTNTGILTGLRLSHRNFYTDFGFAVFTQPFVAPFFSFVWMPFNNHQ